MAAPRSLPKHPERVCWGCAKLCRADDLACGNGTVRTPHPIELFGEDYDASSGDDYDASPGDDYKRTPGEDYDASPGD
jgi:hypothetical protein